MSLIVLLACGESAPVEQDTAALTIQCLAHTAREVEGRECTLLETPDGAPVIWFGRDVMEGHPLEVRVMWRDEALQTAIEVQTAAWNEVLETHGVLVEYVLDETASVFDCVPDAYEGFTQQTVGFCVASADEWAQVISEPEDGAYSVRMNSPCDATLRGAVVMVNERQVEAWGQRSVGKSLGHLSSLISVDLDDALMADGWAGEPVPGDAEGRCVAYHYRN